MINIPVRFFSYCINEECNADICEISEVTFLSLRGVISYDRHTIFNNGVNQICLTIEPIDYPLESEIRL